MERAGRNHLTASCVDFAKGWAGITASRFGITASDAGITASGAGFTEQAGKNGNANEQDRARNEVHGIQPFLNWT